MVDSPFPPLGWHLKCHWGTQPKKKKGLIRKVFDNFNLDFILHSWRLVVPLRKEWWFGALLRDCECGKIDEIRLSRASEEIQEGFSVWSRGDCLFCNLQARSRNRTFFLLWKTFLRFNMSGVARGKLGRLVYMIFFAIMKVRWFFCFLSSEVLADLPIKKKVMADLEALSSYSSSFPDSFIMQSNSFNAISWVTSERGGMWTLWKNSQKKKNSNYCCWLC